MNKIKELIEKHEALWKIANTYIRLEHFECYNPQHYINLLQKLYTGEIGKREFVGQLLDLEREQYFLYDHVDNLLGNCEFNFINNWDLVEEMIIFVAPFEEKRYLLLDWIDGYTTEKEDSQLFVPKDEIIDLILDDDEEQRDYLIRFKQEQDALY